MYAKPHTLLNHGKQWYKFLFEILFYWVYEQMYKIYNKEGSGTFPITEVHLGIKKGTYDRK